MLESHSHLSKSPSKAEIKAILGKYREMLTIPTSNNPGSVLEDGEFATVRSGIDTLHKSRAEAVIGCGIDSIYVAKTDRGPFSFHVKREDGSVEAFRINLCSKSRAILKKYEKQFSRRYLEAEDFASVRSALNNHPKSKKKIGCGVKAIFVAKTTIDDSYCFHVMRVDGSEEDFSYNSCFGKKSPLHYDSNKS